VRELICLLGRLDLSRMVNLRRLLFIKRLTVSDNVSMFMLMYNHYMKGPELKNIQDCYNIQLHWSPGKIRNAAFVSFKNMFV